MVEIKIDDELILEDNLIKTLCEGDRQWTYESHIKTHDDLWANFRKILEANNKDILDDHPLTDAEFHQIQSQMEFASFYEAGKFLVGENGVAKIPLQREDATLGMVMLTVFRRQDVAGGSSVYQVINQFQAPKTNHMDRNARFDVTLLFNGLPLIQIELKKRNVSHMEAFEQITNYVSTDKYHGLFSCLQTFVISNGHTTRYIAASNDIERKKQFLTRWNNSENEAVDDLFDFAREVLSIPQAHQLISFYSVLDNDSKNIIILRPYQIHAIKALQVAASNHQSGYIWHTTGSGKTLTSYKASRNLYQIPRIQKTIFLVDRVDLDQQTTNSFLSYAQNDSVDIESTENVGKLKKHLLSNDRSVVVTTVQKLNYLIGKGEHRINDRDMQKMKNLEIAFVVDECHRAISPEQQDLLKKFFVNSLWYGFTGTPIFAENKKKAIGNLPQTTEEQFGKRLHEYTIKEAIGDGAVLGFQVENKQMISQDYAYEIVEGHFPSKDVYNMQAKDLEKYIANGYFENDDYKLKVIDQIINNMALKFALDREAGKSYGALLTTSSIKDAQRYYELFKKVKNGESNVKISDRIRKKQADFPKIAITYSISENKEMTKDNYEKMKIALADYNEEFATNFSLETLGAYNRNLNDRMARKKNKYKLRSEQIDIVIVVDRLLTGFDAPSMGLLFIDRPPMTPQGLIQAFSRTNRLYDERKTYGQIVTFRTPYAYEKAIKNAFSLYSNGGGNFVTAPDYKDAKARFEDAADNLLQFKIVENPESQMGYDTMREFLRTFQKFDKANAAVMVYSDYTSDEDYYKNLISEEELEAYADFYNYIRALIPDGSEDDGEIDLLDISYEPVSIRSNIIDYSYLTSLIQEKANNRREMNNKNSDEIEKTLAELIKQNPAKGEVYRQINEEIDQNPDKYQNSIIDDVAKDKFNTIIQKNINDFVDNYKVNKEDLEFLIANYPIDKKEVKKPLGEDKLIKNANKDLYNEESGENLSLLKFKSMLRKDTHKFIREKIRPYFE